MSTALQDGILKNKHFILNQKRLTDVQKALGTKTETETIETALQMVLDEKEADRIRLRAEHVSGCLPLPTGLSPRPPGPDVNRR